MSGPRIRDQVADVVKARKAGRGVDSAGAGRAEFRLEGGRRVTVAGLPDDRPETILAALKEVAKQVQALVQAAAGEKAA